MTIDLKALRETAAREIRRGASGLCPPQTVIALLDRLEAAEKALAEPVVKENLTTEYDQTALELCNVCGWKAVIPTAGCLNCAREKQLMKKPPVEPAGEPVATVKSWTSGSYWRNYKLEWHKDVCEGTKLYTSPPPPAEPVVEPFGYFRAEPFGWTDCAPTDEGAKALYEMPPPAEPAVDPIGYVTAPITWKSERFHSEQSMKITQHRQPVYGFMHPIYAAPPPAEVPLTDEAIAETMANVWGCASIAPRQAPEFARAIERLIKGVRL